MNKRTIILNVVSIALLVFLPAIGLVFMWIFAPLKKWVKALVTPFAVTLTLIGIASVFPGIFLKLFGLI